MEKKVIRIICFTIALLIVIAIVAYANAVFLLAFAGILLGILLNAIGRAARWLTHLPYPLALTLALIFILGFLALIFWLYSPTIAEQFQLLLRQLPQAYESARNYLIPFFGEDFLSLKRLREELPFTSKGFYTQVLSVFSTTLGSIVSFAIFLIVGLYLAYDPQRYKRWILALVPSKKQKKVGDSLENIGKSLRWWLLGKLLSMVIVGVSLVIGLSLLNVSLALILGFLAGLLNFIPYVGSILASIPAILIGFAQSPLQAFYVAILYLGINMVEGYFLTPYIEQRTVSIPPALTIMSQVLLVLLTGAMGLALATPLVVVAVALAQQALHRKSAFKMVQKAQETDYD